MDAPGVAQAPQRFGGTKSVAVVDPGAGRFHESRRRHNGGRDRFEPGLPALRLSRGGLLGATAVVPAGALRAAGSCRDGPETRRATEHRTQDHARSAALRPDLAGRFKTRTGGGVLFVHVADGHGCAGDRHRLSTQRVRGLGPVNLSARRVAPGVTLVRS